MPKVDFAQTDDLSEVAGLGQVVLGQLRSGTYPGINYKIKKISDIKKNDMEKLPLEAYLTITHTAGRQYTRDEVEKVANLVMKKLKIDAAVVGSYRRGLDHLNDVDLLTTDSRHPQKDDKDFKIIRNGESQAKLMVRLPGSHHRSRFMTSEYEYVPTDILITTRARYPFALLHFTGSKEHNIKLRNIAKSKGYSLSQHGLYRPSGYVEGLTTEKKIFKALGLDYVPPQNRW